MTPEEKAASDQRLIANRSIIDAASEAFGKGMSGKKAMKHVKKAAKKANKKK